MNLMRIGLTAMMTAVLSMGIACAQEPVDPQPAKPLTYVHPSYHKVTPDVAKKMMEEGVVLIDVREPKEFAEGHVKGAINVPLSVFKRNSLPDFFAERTNSPVFTHTPRSASA